MKILIVEDSRIIAEDIKSGLEQLDYEIVGIAKTYAAASDCLEENEVDFVLIDIMLGKTPEGIDVARKVKEVYCLPFIFLTSHGDVNTVNSALKTEPNGYLMKPFERKQLYAAIEVAMLNFNERFKTKKDTQLPNKQLFDSVFVKENNVFKKINYSEIYHLKSDGNYLEIFTKDRKYILRLSFKDFLKKADKNQFFQTHRSHVVNTNFISNIGTDFVTVNGINIPLGRSQRVLLLKEVSFFS